MSSVALAADRPRLERRARLLAWGGNAWHVIEFAIALGAGIAAGSVALVAFGVDSLIEAAAGLTIVWRFSGSRLTSATSERTAQRVIAFSYFLLAAYVGVVAIRDLVGGHEPGVSWIGIGLAAFTAPTMPFLARAKRGVGHARFGGDRGRGWSEHDLRVPLDRAARRAARECARGLVVG
jgi:divalent metal cation (Fe/Co/Zn/Cd) transporter